jgi:hypothetical protein
MEYNNIIETIGSITKMEILESLRNDVLSDSLVLRNILPFPGYNNKKDNLNFLKNQESIFIILRYQYPAEKINLLFKKLVHERIIKCYACYGEIVTTGLVYPCIRLKGLENYGLIAYIQQFFMKHTIQLMNYKNINGFASIKIFKPFRILKIGDGVYRDANDVDKVYIRIPVSMNWNDFDVLTKKIKLNFDNPNFDGALGTIYRFYGTEEVIRIYDKEITLEKAKQLKMLYLKEIEQNSFILSRHLQPD